jgi:NAD-dependent dihydropyrimidine dehydrogenase PreA subunit
MGDVQVKIENKGCRGCTMCVDICPCDVFDYDASSELALAARTVDCIGCYSCFYACPSQCIEIANCHQQRPFYRIEQNVALVERFLQAKTATKTLATSDWQEAEKDVASTMVALARAILEMMGRGIKALGRKSGAVAAGHLPEIYEEKSLDGVLKRVQERFQNCFNFEFQRAGEEIDFSFHPCVIGQIVSQAGDKIGEAVSCQIFHEYLVGLLGAYAGVSYRYQMPKVGETCVMRVSPQ